MRALKSNTTVIGCGSHRIYRDQNGTDIAFCRFMPSINELVRLAGGIDRIELRQASSADWIPEPITDALIENLRRIDLVSDSADPRAEQVEREARRRIVDAMARIRIRYNRNVLAGLTRVFSSDEEQLVLAVVLARKDVRSCEWHLAV